MGDMLNAKQAAQILGCSPDDVLVYRQRGLLRGYRHKTRFWRFRREDVENLAKGGHISSAQQGGGSEKATVRRSACAYAGPGDSHRYVGLLDKGKAVHVTEEHDDWCAFLTDSGVKAWVKASNLAKKGPFE